LSLNLKYVELSTNFMAFKNSCFGIFVYSSIINYLLSNKSMIMSIGTFVSNEITSKEKKL